MNIALPAFYRLLAHERIGSTNDEAKRLAEEGAPEGTLVWALEQTAGRGRRGNSWVSPRGNLYISLVLRPECTAAAAPQLGFAAALAVGDACAAALPRSGAITLKWPNDVLLDGRKLAGMLLESRLAAAAALDWLVLGIGVNVAAHPEGTEYPATSLAAAGAGTVQPEALLADLATRLLDWYERWRRPGGFAAVREAWLGRAQGLGGDIRVRLPQEELHGRFAGLDGDGALLLDAAGGRRRIAAAEVFPAG